MAMVMPNLLAPIKKEVSYLRHYSRSRPRFKLHLAVDAVLSMVLVFAVFEIATANSRHNLTDTLKSSGAVAFSAKELRDFVREEKLVAYWAGPNSADKYTLISTTAGEVTISYFPKNADIGKVDASTLVVQTHNHFTANEAQAYSRDVAGPGSFQMSQGESGNSIEYNPATPYRVLVTIKNQNSTVTIYNSVPQASLTLAMKPGVIQKVV